MASEHSHTDAIASNHTMHDALNVQDLGRASYLETWQRMRDFTHTRTAQTPDEIWVCEHPPVFTLGLAGDPGHLLVKSDIPMVKTDRGGQITYHGPGQLVIYPLLDLKRYGLKVREYVQLLEQSLIDVLVACGLPDAQRKPDAPGVYLPRSGHLVKVAALGIKVSRGCSYHGLSLNVDMDMAPFSHINPCGYAGLETIDMAAAGVKISFNEMQLHLVKNILEKLEAKRLAVLQSP